MSDSESWRTFDQGITLTYELNDNVSTYAKAVTGYKAGGYNVRSTEEGFLPAFDEEEMISYEVGLKSTWIDQRLLFNTALFSSYYSDMQLQQIIDNRTIFLSDIFNAGKAEIKGLELEVTALISRSLSMSFTYGYTDAEFTEVIDNNPNSQTFQRNIHDSYVMPYAAEHSYRVSMNYEYSPFSFGLLRANLEYAWIDERYGVPQNEDIEGWLIPDFGTLSGRLSLSDIEIPIGTMEISFWGKNIENKEYLLHAMSHTFFRAGYFGELASYGLDFVIRN